MRKIEVSPDSGRGCWLLSLAQLSVLHGSERVGAAVFGLRIAPQFPRLGSRLPEVLRRQQTQMGNRVFREARGADAIQVGPRRRRREICSQRWEEALLLC